MKSKIERRNKSLRRKDRVTYKTRKSTGMPVLYVFRSNKYVYAQIVDFSGKTLLGVASSSISRDLEEIKADKTAGKDDKVKPSETEAQQGKNNDSKPEGKAKETLKVGEKDNKGKIGISFETGKILAQRAKALNIEKVVFNRGKYNYHGRIKALAEGARKGGLKF